jgi:hypothetical protein
MKDRLAITDAGNSKARFMGAAPDGFRTDRLLAQLGKAERLIVERSPKSYPAVLSKEEVATATKRMAAPRPPLVAH